MFNSLKYGRTESTKKKNYLLREIKEQGIPRNKVLKNKNQIKSQMFTMIFQLPSQGQTEILILLEYIRSQ